MYEFAGSADRQFGMHDSEPWITTRRHRRRPRRTGTCWKIKGSEKSSVNGMSKKVVK
jgi:hypothetical protein